MLLQIVLLHHSNSLLSQKAARAFNSQQQSPRTAPGLWQNSVYKHSCSLHKPLQLCALVAKVRCLHKLELCDRTVCQGITAVLYFGQKAAAFCLLLCWKSKYIARQLACFVSKFDLTRVLLHMSLAAYTALDLVEPCSQPLPVTCNSTTTHAILLPVVSLSTSAARFTSVPNICRCPRQNLLRRSSL